MRGHLVLLAILALLLPVGAYAKAGAEPSGVAGAWSQAWQAKRLDAVMQLYSDDAIFMDPSGVRISGRAQLRSFFAGVLARYTAYPSLHSVRSVSSGDLGYDSGDYTEVLQPVASPGGSIRTHGSYLFILRKLSGRWLITTQMWTAAPPTDGARFTSPSRVR